VTGLKATPAAVAPTDPEPAPRDPSPDPEPTRTTPGVESIVPTDYGIATVRVTNDPRLLQRRFTVGISAANTGRAGPETVTVTMAFRRNIQFRGVVSPGWSCGSAVRNQRLRTLTCSTTLAAGRGTTFTALARNIVQPAGTVSVAAPGDPAPGNNSARFRFGLWPLT
jgi:hypothetical protein